MGRMKLAIGLGIGQDQIRLVAVRRGQIISVAEAPLAVEDSLARTVTDLLGHVERRKFERITVAAAVGPAYSQLRLLEGLPLTTNQHLMSSVVRETPTRWFLHFGSPLVTTDVRPIAPGRSWGGALDRIVVEAVEKGCADAGCRLVWAAPTVAMLRRALLGERVIWPDGETASEIRFEANELREIRRISVSAPSKLQPPDPVPALAALGSDGWRFADAYAAATEERDASELAYKPPGADRPPLWRIGSASAALVVGILLVLFLPGVRAIWLQDTAGKKLATLLDERLASDRIARELSLMTSALQEVDNFLHNRQSQVAFLASITRALPDTTVIVSVEVDSTGGTMTFLTSRAAGVVPPLEALPRISGIEVLGAVTREFAAGGEMERVTVRFKLLGRDRNQVASATEGTQ
jgi:hypothetical protein